MSNKPTPFRGVASSSARLHDEICGGSTTLLLAGCATLPPPLSTGVTLSVRSRDRTTGTHVSELQNTTARPVLYLDPYLTFHHPLSCSGAIPAIAPRNGVDGP
jgi:hypothetical protein